MNSAKAIGALLRNYPYYGAILAACQDPAKSVADLAEITTTKLIRQGAESNQTRIDAITNTYAANQTSLVANIAAFENKGTALAGEPIRNPAVRTKPEWLPKRQF